MSDLLHAFIQADQLNVGCIRSAWRKYMYLVTPPGGMWEHPALIKEYGYLERKTNMGDLLANIGC